MLQRLYEQSEPVEAALADLRTETTPLSSDDLEAISQSLLVLSVFHEVTQELSSEMTVSCSKLIPLHNLLQHAVTAHLADIRHPTAVTLREKLMENLRAVPSPEKQQQQQQYHHQQQQQQHHHHHHQQQQQQQQVKIQHLDPAASQPNQRSGMHLIKKSISPGNSKIQQLMQFLKCSITWLIDT
ncbi:hypothetical protein LDENG_00071860 [Lucifuga dentata]|nr:hypothetical protein LDENG_00071860 [Lucifuga dentata]